MSLEIAADTTRLSCRRTRKPRAPERIDGRTRQARRAVALANAYAARLGKAADDPTVKADVERLAELEAHTWALRGALLRGDPSIDLVVLDRLERLADRKRRQLGLEKPPTRSLPSLSSYRRGDK